MQRISRAPELSATFSLDSCWIMTSLLLRLLDHVDKPPALRLRERARLDDSDHVSLACLVALVVRVQGARAAHDLLVRRVTADDVDPHRDRFLALVGDDDALAHLCGVRIALCGRRARAGLVLGLGRGASPATHRSGGPPVGEALRGPLLRAELGAGLARTPRPLQPPPVLPGHVRVVSRPGVLRGRLVMSVFPRRLFSRRGLSRFLGRGVGGGIVRSVVGRGRLLCGGRGLGGVENGGIAPARRLLRGRVGRSRHVLVRRLYVFFLVVRHCYFLSSFSTSIPRSLATVISLATSRREAPMPAVFSSSPVACRKRRLNASRLASISCATSSSSLRLCAWPPFISPRPPRGRRIWFAPGACDRRGAAPPWRGLREPRPAQTCPCRA